MSVVIKEYKRKKRIRLSVKLFIMTVSLVFITILAFTFVGVDQLNKFTSAIFTLGQEQNEIISENLSESMKAEAEESFLNYAKLAAETTNHEFKTSKHDLEIMASEVQHILYHPELYQPIDVNIPRAEDDGEYTLQLLHSEDISEEDALISARESRLGNIEPIVKAMLNRNHVTRDCGVTLVNGTTILYDNVPASKIMHDGRIKPYEASVRPWYVGAELSGQVYFSQLTSDYYIKQMQVMLGVPVYVNGELAAVCGCSVYMDDLSGMFDHTKINEYSYACVISESGTIVYSGKDDGELGEESNLRKSILRSANLDLVRLTEKALSGESGFDMVSLDGENCYVAYAPIKLTGWTEYIVIREDDLYRDIYDLTDKTSDISKKSLDATKDNADMVAVNYIFVAFLLLVAAALSSIFFAKSMVKPILMLRDAGLSFIDRVDYEESSVPEHFGRLDISTGDEIEDLWLTMEDMEINIAITMRRIRKYTEEKARLNAELSIAAEIQANVLPKNFPAFPERDEFDIYASMTPAKEVGGDFYDFFLIDDDHLGMVMADVSDKGVPAAMFMMTSRTILKDAALSGRYRSPADILAYANNKLIEGNSENMFVTVWMGILTISTRKMVSASAGHEFPVVYRSGRGFEIENDVHSPFLGVYDDMVYTDFEWQFEKNDMFFIYTDGVPEATNAEDEMFGNERMVASLNRHADSESLKEILDGVKGDVDSFVGKANQFDDLTMLILRCL